MWTRRRPVHPGEDNTQQEAFPASLIASRFGFQRAEFFAAGEEERAAPQVDLSLRRSQ